MKESLTQGQEQEQKSKFVGAVQKIFEDFKLEQVHKANDGKITLDDLAEMDLDTKFRVLDSIYASQEVVSLDKLRDSFCKQIVALELGGKKEQEALTNKVKQAYIEATEPSKLDVAARAASAAIDSAKETASSAAKKLLNTLPRPRFFRESPSDESLRPIIAPNAYGFSLADSPSSASPPPGSPTPSHNKKRKPRRKKAPNTATVGVLPDQESNKVKAVEVSTGSPSSSEELPPLPKSAELNDLQPPSASEQVALPTQNEDEMARQVEEKRKAEEAAELKRQEEAAEKARLEKEAEERRLEAERQKAEQERLRKIEEAEQARLKQIEDERIAREAAERAIQEAQRRAEEEAAEQKRLEEQKLIDEKAAVEAWLAEIPVLLEEKREKLRIANEDLGSLNTQNEEIRNDFYLNYVISDLKAKRESLVPIKFLFKGRLSVLEKEGGNYTSASDEDKNKILDKLVNTGIYSFEFVRQALSSFYEKRKTSYKKYLDMCQGAEQIKNNMRGDAAAIREALLPLTVGDFSPATNDEFTGQETKTKKRLSPDKPFGTRAWLLHHLDEKAKLDQNVQRLNRDIVALEQDKPQCERRLAVLNAQLNPGRQEQVDPVPDKSSAFTLVK